MPKTTTKKSVYDYTDAEIIVAYHDIAYLHSCGSDEIAKERNYIRNRYKQLTRLMGSKQMELFNKMSYTKLARLLNQRTKLHAE